MTAHEELRALAEAATPGPWRHDGRGSVMALPHSRAQALPGGTPREVQLACVTGQAAMHGDPERDPAELRDATAAYIAAASPDVVLSLLAEIDALRAERAWQPIETAPPRVPPGVRAAPGAGEAHAYRPDAAPEGAVTRERIGLHNCPVVEVTGDGRACGRCWFYLPGPEHKTCPRHGDVSLEVEVYIREGKTTREDRRPTAPSATPTAS